MKHKLTSKKLIGIDYITFLIVLMSTVLIMLFRPSNKTFQYQYYKGKFWQYDKLIANYDFPIYKTESELEKERDSIRGNSPIIFYLDKSVKKKAIDYLQDITHRSNDVVYTRVYPDLLKILTDIYNNGIISKDTQSLIKDNGGQELYLKNGDNSFESKPIGKFLNIKEAFDLINNELSQKIDPSDIDKLKINNLLQINVIKDTITTDKIYKDAIQKIALTVDVVQKGDVIVDKGQIVDDQIFNILNSLKKEEQKKQNSVGQIVASSWGLFIICFLVLYLLSYFLNSFCEEIFSVIKNKVLIFSIILLALIVTELGVSYSLSESNVFIEYLIPYISLIILFRSFFNSRVAWTSYVVTVVLSSIFVRNSIDFTLIQLIAGLSALIYLRNIHDRNKITITAFIIMIIYIILIVSLNIYHNGTITLPYIYKMLITLTFHFLLLMFVSPTLSLIEKRFGYASNIILVELGDLNTPILKELSEVAPGTFQHSVQVSILATEAARKVGANELLVRTGALYHDIGKIKEPSYFTENQGVTNPHDGLNYKDSARIVINHVHNGIVMAHKHKIPNQIIEFIKTHHGRSKTKYFYNLYCNEHIGEYIDVESFTYPGPNPYSKETGILMLADAVEASSRSLKEHTEEGIKELINKIIDGIVYEGLLNDTPLTFKDISTIKEVFFQKIKVMYHSRISYPEKIIDNR